MVTVASFGPCLLDRSTVGHGISVRLWAHCEWPTGISFVSGLSEVAIKLTRLSTLFHYDLIGPFHGPLFSIH